MPDVISVYEKLPNSFIRKKALEVALDQIRAEDRNTKYLDIGPVGFMHIYVCQYSYCQKIGQQSHEYAGRVDCWWTKLWLF